jgi:hypothetical protein
MIPYFGNILCKQMIRSGSGKIAYDFWYKLPKHFSFVSLNEFVVMPNHVHVKEDLFIFVKRTKLFYHRISNKRYSGWTKGT